MNMVYFISGIDTNIGKSFATGLLASVLEKEGRRVITQKMIQTGCDEISEDIEMHRQLQGVELSHLDRSGATCVYLFSYPCSPHLAARLDGVTIELDLITQATQNLDSLYEIVLLEGAGGLMVPIDQDVTTIDYVAACNYPVILVTSGRLGSINHTLLSLEACRSRGIFVAAVIYNEFPATDSVIAADTYSYLSSFLLKHHKGTHLLRLPEMVDGQTVSLKLPESLFA